MPQCTDISTVRISLKYTFVLDDEGDVSLWSHMIYAAICVLRTETAHLVRPKCTVYILVVKCLFCKVLAHNVTYTANSIWPSTLLFPKAFIYTTTIKLAIYLHTITNAASRPLKYCYCTLGVHSEKFCLHLFDCWNINVHTGPKTLAGVSRWHFSTLETQWNLNIASTEWMPVGK